MATVRKSFTNDTVGFSTGSSATAFLAVLAFNKLSPGVLSVEEGALAMGALTVVLAYVGRLAKYLFIDRKTET